MARYGGGSGSIFSFPSRVQLAVMGGKSAIGISDGRLDGLCNASSDSSGDALEVLVFFGIGKKVMSGCQKRGLAGLAKSALSNSAMPKQSLRLWLWLRGSPPWVNSVS